MNNKNDFFKETFKLLNTNLRKFKYRLKNNKFDIYEKKLLKAFYAFRTNDSKVLDSLKSFKVPSNEFLEATRLYLLGLSYNHYTKYAFAAEKLELSLKVFDELKENDFASYATTSLLLVYSNISDIERMEYCLNKLNNYSPCSSYHGFLIEHAKAVGYLEIGDHSELLKILNKCLSSNDPAIKPIHFYFVYINFNYNLKTQNYDACYDVLEELKLSPGFRNKVLYKFNKILLNYIAKDNALYLYANELEDYPVLLSQVEYLKAKEGREDEKAAQHWRQLSKHNPEVYLANETYKGATSIFSEALKKQLSLKSPKKELCLKHLNSLSSQLEKVDYLLKNTPKAITKDEFIKHIWGDIEITEAVEARLRNLIRKYRKQYQVEVKGKQGTYKLAS